MRFNPFADPLDLGPLRQLCEAMGLPAPSGLDLFDPPGPVVYGHLRFEEGGGSLLGLDRDSVDGTGFFGALAASRMSEGEAGLIGRPAMVPPRDILGGWAWVSRPVPGQRGDHFLATEQGSAEVVCRATGRFLGRLWDVPAFQAGCRANPEGLGPVGADWATDWRARITRYVRLAHRRGVGFPILKRLMAVVEGAALPDVPPCLGLADLSPDRLFFHEGEVVAALGWESAFAGDPLASLGGVLHLPGPLLALVLDETGQGDAIRAEVPRLKAYAASAAIRALADAGSQSRPPALRAERIEHALDLARSALDGSLEARLSGEGAVRHDGLVRVRLRRAFNALSAEPIVGAHRPVLQAALATAILAHDFAHSPLEAGWCTVADRYLGHVELGLTTRVSGALQGDWKTRFEALFQRCAGSGSAVRTDALVGNWLAWLAFGRLGGEVDAAVIEGLDEWSAVAAAGERGVLPAHDALLSGVLGLGAALDIQAKLGLLEGSVPLVAALAEQVTQAWDVLAGEGNDPDRTPARQTLAHYANPDAHAEVSVPVAPLLLAIRAAEQDLPAPPAEILKQLGVPPC